MMGNLMIGLKVTAIGFSTVFLVLVMLWFIIDLFGKFVSSIEKKPEAAPKVAAPAPQTAAATTAPKQDNNELIAVIAAAVAASGGSGKAVKSISIVNGTSGASWTVASRADAMASRL